MNSLLASGLAPRGAAQLDVRLDLVSGLRWVGKRSGNMPRPVAPSGGEYPDSRLTYGEMSTSPVDLRPTLLFLVPRRIPDPNLDFSGALFRASFVTDLSLVDRLGDGALVGGPPVAGALPPDDERLDVHGPAGLDGLRRSRW